MQGLTSTDRVSAYEAGEESSTELLHCSHVVGCKLAGGLRITMALAGVMWRGDRDWNTRLLPRRQRGSWSGRRLGACAAATMAWEPGLRRATTLTLLGWIGWEHRKGDDFLSLLILGLVSGRIHNCWQSGRSGIRRR